METKNKKIKVATKYHGFRLDIFLSEKLKISRSQIQKIITQNLVTLNNNKIKKSGQMIQAGDIVEIKQENKTTLKTIKISPSIKKINEVEKKLNVKIIKETDDYLIIDKPSGLITHPTQKMEPISLAGWLIKKYPQLKNIGEDPIRPGIVHRLDKEASGLLVVAKTQKMFNHLKHQFKNRTVDKKYSVLVHGQVIKDWDEINFPISRSEKSEKMAATPKTVKGLLSQTGKEAKTEFSIIKRYANLTLLEVKIHTGRTHQIRAHMLAYNHPIVGDPLYLRKKQKRKWDEQCGRLFLHCFELGFNDLNGDKVVFNSPLPQKLNNFLNQIPQNSDKFKQGLLVIISSPSGGGKDTVIKELLNEFPGSNKFITTITRPLRPGEKEDIDHHYRTQDEFKEMIKNNKFIEYNKYAGNYYGTEKDILDKMLKQHHLIFSNIDVNGKKSFDQANYKHLSIFLMPDNLEVLKNRIIKRGGIDKKTLENRLKTAKNEIAQANIYDHIIINYDGKLTETVEQIKEIIKKKLVDIDKNS